MKRPEDLSQRVERTSAVFSREARLLGQRIRGARLTCGWTLDDAAERSGLDPKHLQKVEAGSINITLLSLVRIAHCFRTDVRTLFSPHLAKISRRAAHRRARG